MRPVTDTLRLIRLLDGTLSVSEGAELREQLANDESLRHGWRRVNAVLGQPTSFTKWEEVDPFDGAEQIAALVEGHGADDHDIAESDDFVHELTSLDRWQRATDAADVQVPAAVRDRMAGAVLEQIQPRSGRKSTAPRGASHRFNGAYREVQPSAASRTVARRNSHRRRRSENRQVTWAVAVIAGIVLLSLVGWRAMWKPAGQVRPNIEDVAEGTIDPDDSPEPAIDVPAHQDGNDEPPRQQPDAGDAHSQIVHQAPDEVIEVEEDIDPVPPTPPATVAQREMIEWQQIVGIVVTTDAESTDWRGVMVPAKDVVSSDVAVPPIVFRSLRESWGRGNIESGIEFTLGEETLVSLAVEVADVQTVHASIERGLLAIGGLSRDAVVQCEATSMRITLRSMMDGSRIAFILSGDSRGVLVLAGEVAVGDLIVAAPAGIEWNGGEPHVISTVRPIDWIEPPARIPAEQEWINACLAEADVVSALLRTDSGQSDRTLAAAADWSIALNASQAVPLAAASTKSVHREAALAWLLDVDNDADQHAAVWNNLRPMLAETELSVSQWFEIARGEADVTPEILQELAIGVGRSEPLFVRHAAIRFLREATGQRFASYDPESPTQNAVTEIRAHVRQLTRPNMRQQRSGRQ